MVTTPLEKLFRGHSNDQIRDFDDLATLEDSRVPDNFTYEKSQKGTVGDDIFKDLARSSNYLRRSVGNISRFKNKKFRTINEVIENHLKEQGVNENFEILQIQGSLDFNKIVLECEELVDRNGVDSKKLLFCSKVNCKVRNINMDETSMWSLYVLSVESDLNKLEPTYREYVAVVEFQK